MKARHTLNTYLLRMNRGFPTFNGPFIIWNSFIILFQKNLLLPILCHTLFVKYIECPVRGMTQALPLKPVRMWTLTRDYG